MDAISAQPSQQIWTTEEIGYLETARHLEKNGLAVKNGEMPAVNVMLSDESLQWATEHNAKTFAKQLDGATADGTSVSVRRAAGMYSSTPDIQDGYINTDVLEGYVYSADFTDATGNSVSVEFTGDITSALNADGNRSIYFYNSNTTRTYGTDGSYVEAEGNRITEDTDAIYISTSGGNIVTGNGNNLIFVYGDNASIQGGSGNDDIRIAGAVSNVTIDTGAGDDTISGSTVYDLEVSLNDGNNTVSLKTITGGSITAGDGDNRLNVTNANAASIILGDGENIYDGYGLGNGTSLTMGDGANKVDIYTVGISATRTQDASNAAVNLGNGNNYAKIYEIQSGSEIFLGNGNNSLQIYGIESGSLLKAGNGNNTITMYQVIEGSTLRLGNGNNNLKLYGIDSGSEVTLGNGANRAKIYEVENNSYLGFGNGNNALQLYGLYNSLLTMGDGDNDTSIYKMSGNAKMQTGDGNSLIQVDYMEDESQILAGEGENAFYISKYSSPAFILDSSGNAFSATKINSLMKQGLWGSLNDLETVRSERESQGGATVFGFENDVFFNDPPGSSIRNLVELPSKTQVEALRSYTRVSSQNNVKLNQG